MNSINDSNTMNDRKDITHNFGNLYEPKAALVVYASCDDEREIYVEHFDIDRDGKPINAHPLTVKEAQAMARALKVSERGSSYFLKPEGLLPNNILCLDACENGFAIWWTKAGYRNLFFANNLEIPNGKAQVPALLWRADRQGLHIYALKGERKPTGQTALYHAPFFNVYESGNVCMGSVNIDIEKATSLEAFITAWEQYFFESYFSHLNGSYSVVRGNLVSLWKRLLKTGEPFPKDVLIATNRTIKHLL